MTQLLTDAITGAKSPRNIEAYLSGPVGAETTRIATRDALYNGSWFDKGLKVFPEPSDNSVDDFGVQTGGGFTAEIVAVPDTDNTNVFTNGANLFANPTEPVTQVVTLAAGQYCLWFIGLGTITVAAGTASITGAGTTTANGVGQQSTPVVFNVTVGGTVNLTVVKFDSTAGAGTDYYQADAIGSYV